VKIFKCKNPPCDGRHDECDACWVEVKSVEVALEDLQALLDIAQTELEDRENRNDMLQDHEEVTNMVQRYQEVLDVLAGR
jgi:hypothetical protein